MKILGINALNHDASLAVVDESGLLYWKKAGVLSGVAHDEYLNQLLVDEAMSLGPVVASYYEKPIIKKLRQARAGQWSEVFNLDMLPSRHLTQFGINLPVTYQWHHASHAAAGWFTSPFTSSAIVVIDAMGEWTTASIWQAQEGKPLKCLWQLRYPDSIGLFYSAFTHLIGFKPAAEEHLLQKFSDSGFNPRRYYNTVKSYIDTNGKLKYNLHKGIVDWSHPIELAQDEFDLAAAVQIVFEETVSSLMEKAKELTNEQNLIYMGGCSLNSKFNTKLDTWWDKVWSLPNPGDSSSSIGAALLLLDKKITWTGELSSTVRL